MKQFLPIAFLFAVPFGVYAEPEFPLTEDSKVQQNVPKGELIKFHLNSSVVYPGTFREISVYIPRQYNENKPACVYVNQDGVQWNAPVVFDNLISKGEMPVVVGIFIRPGVVKALDDKTALSRFNRSLEYDGLGPDYSRFVLEEVLPAVERLVTADGRRIVLSKNGNDRAIGGSSSGAIAAFTAAWERSDAFSRVFNVVCTMVGLRGANEYPTLIRKFEPKPIRLFQQDGSNDNNIYGGDWWMANQELERALTFAGYEHEHVWGEGGHNGKHGTAVFPDAMRFLWKGWPEPVKAGPGNNRMLNEILIPGENWQVVWEGQTAPERLISNKKGEVFVSDKSKTHKLVSPGKQEEVSMASIYSAGPEERFYGLVPSEQKLVAYDKDGKLATITDGIRGTHLTVLANGNMYVTETTAQPDGEHAIWLVRPDGSKQALDKAKTLWGGITVSTDQSLLYVNDARSHWVYSYQIQPDGTLAHKQRYYWLHTPDTADDAGAARMQIDTAGRLYVASRMGVQVCDQAGRVNFILPTPDGAVEDLVFGGEALDTVYAISGNKIYRRLLKTKGVLSFEAPSKPAAPHL